MENRISWIDKAYSKIYKFKLIRLGAIIENSVVICYGAKLKFKSELYIGENTVVGRKCIIEADKISIGKNCLFFSNSKIYSNYCFEISERGKISKNCIFKANNIVIGKEFWCNEAVRIGEGGWNQRTANLTVGDYQFIGLRAQINLSESVVLEGYGGIGIEAMIFTHGAGHGQPITEGFYAEQKKVKIEKFVSVLTRAVILPGVTIREKTTVAANSIVTKNFPSNSLIGGIPAKFIKKSQKLLSDMEKEKVLINSLVEGLDSEPLLEGENYFFDISSKKVVFTYNLEDSTLLNKVDILLYYNKSIYIPPSYKGTIFNLKIRTIQGVTSKQSELLRDKLRRKGILLDYVGYTPFSLDYNRLIERNIE